MNGLIKTSLFASAIAVCSLPAFGQKAPSPSQQAKATAKLSKDSTYFVENAGQWRGGKFVSSASGLNFWITQTGIVLDYYKQVGKQLGSGRSGQSLNLNFVGANPHSQVQGVDRLPLVNQYIHAHRPIVEAHTYQGVDIDGLYPGVDLRVHKDSGFSRFDLLVAPGADASNLKLQVTGAKKLSLDKTGSLVMGTSIGNLDVARPVAYQLVDGKRQPVTAKFKLLGNREVRFALGAYDHSKQLVIDPIIYGSYYGGDAGADEVRAVTADGTGGVFMTGNTFAIDFPLVMGPYITLNGESDAFITLFQGDAYVHNFASYFGGSNDETGKYIAVDPTGNNIWIAGTTSSGDFPMINGTSYQQTLKGSTNIFLFEWTKDQTNILIPSYATYFSSTVPANAVELAGFGVAPTTGDVLIAGTTTGTGIPGAVDAYPGAAQNAFITRFNSTGTSVEWSRYVQGSAPQVLGINWLLGLDANDGGTNVGNTNIEANLSAKIAPDALAVDKDENAIIGGTVIYQGNQDTSTAGNPGFVTTPGVFQNTQFGQNARLLRNDDLFVEKVDASGNLVYGALVGGADNDFGGAVATDALGNAYITGVSGSFDFPRTSGTFGQIFTQDANCTVTKLNQDASQIIYSTNLRTHQSPAGAVYPVGISVDVRGYAFITGLILDGVQFPTGTPPDPDVPSGKSVAPGGVPVTSDAIRATYTYPAPPDVPSWDGWLIVLDDTATNEIYGTYIGGLADDLVFPPYNDRFGDVWVCGLTDLVRSYETINSTLTAATDHTIQGGIAPFITPLAFKPQGEEGNPFYMINVETPYGILSESPGGLGGQIGFWGTPAPPPFGDLGPLGMYILTSRTRDGYVMRFRLQIPIITNLTLNPSTVPGGLGASSTGTITLDTPATGAGVDVDVTLSNATAASLDPSSEVTSEVVNIPAGATTATFTVYSNVVTDPSQVDVKAEYLDNFKTARLNVVPWLQKLALAPNSLVGGNNSTGVITLAAPAPSGGVDVTLVTSDAGTILFPGGNTVTVPAGQDFVNFTIGTMGVDTQATFTVSASALTVGITEPITLLPANLLSVSFTPGRIAGGSSSTGTVRLDGLPGPSGFNVNLGINGNPVGYSVVPPTLAFTPTDQQLTFQVNTAPEAVNTSKVITADRPLQGTYSHESVTGTLFVDANFLTNFTLSPTTVNAGQTSTGTVTIGNTAEAGGVVVNLVSLNPAVATVPASGNVVIAAGSTNATFTVNTLATAVDTTVTIQAIRGTNTISRTLTVKGVTFTMGVNPNSVIGGAASPSSVGTVTLALTAPAGGVQVNLASSNPSAASVPASVTVPGGSKTATFNINTSQVAVTQNVTITGTTGSATANAVLQVRAISLASLTIQPNYAKGGTTVYITAALDAPAPSQVSVVLTSSNNAVLHPGPIIIPAGAQTSAPVGVVLGRVNRTYTVTVTGTYNGRRISATCTVYR
ncbi:MAG TPA: hypothetical protein VMI31_02435 [Fimbriimonadaceae bacterium]|nr:hypothetical protein [Fimbriimonadaceae bacterium]